MRMPRVMVAVPVTMMMLLGRQDVVVAADEAADEAVGVVGAAVGAANARAMEIVGAAMMNPCQMRVAASRLKRKTKTKRTTASVTPDVVPRGNVAVGRHHWRCRSCAPVVVEPPLVRRVQGHMTVGLHMCIYLIARWRGVSLPFRRPSPCLSFHGVCARIFILNAGTSVHSHVPSPACLLLIVCVLQATAPQAGSCCARVLLLRAAATIRTQQQSWLLRQGCSGRRHHRWRAEGRALRKACDCQQ